MGDLGFMITTDTCCDLPESYIKENGLDLVTLYYNMNGTAYGKEVELEVKEFYDRMRAGEAVNHGCQSGRASGYV